VRFVATAEELADAPSQDPTGAPTSPLDKI